MGPQYRNGRCEVVTVDRHAAGYNQFRHSVQRYAATRYNNMPPPNLLPKQRCQVSSAPEACAGNSNLRKISVYRYLTAVTRSRFKCFRAKSRDEVS
jgi:hypothetical protein